MPTSKNSPSLATAELTSFLLAVVDEDPSPETPELVAEPPCPAKELEAVLLVPEPEAEASPVDPTLTPECPVPFPATDD